MHNLLTVKETAKYLRIPLPTVYYLVQRGQLPAIQIGGRWRIKKSSLDKDILKEDKSGQPTVLVVDDDESLQNLFKLFLRKIGFSRVVVGTVKEALPRIEKQKFDLIFLDLKLPDGPADDVYDSCEKRTTRLSDHHYHRLSRQRNARPDSGQRARSPFSRNRSKSSSLRPPSAFLATKKPSNWRRNVAHTARICRGDLAAKSLQPIATLANRSRIA